MNKSNINYKDFCIAKEESIIYSLKLMDKLKRKLLIVLDDNKFYGLLSIGDLQRAIIANKPLEGSIKTILRNNIKTGTPIDDVENIKLIMLEHRMEFFPIIDEHKEIQTIYFWEDLFQDKIPKVARKLNCPVIIMAGGEGRRLKPLTNIIPKPLVPIAEKTIIEKIMDNFVEVGSHNFFLSVNYKASIIKHYLTELNNVNYNIQYFQEDKPLGTAGSLSLIKNLIKETFFVSNCDIIIEQDYSEIYNYHINNKNAITVVAAMKHYQIPYGIIYTEENGKLITLQEKPEITYKINSGFYIVEPKVLDLIPENTVFHFTDLIERAMINNYTIGVFPVSEKSWIDIGTWREYLQSQPFNENNLLK